MTKTYICGKEIATLLSSIVSSGAPYNDIVKIFLRAKRLTMNNKTEITFKEFYSSKISITFSSSGM